MPDEPALINEVSGERRLDRAPLSAAVTASLVASESTGTAGAGSSIAASGKGTRYALDLAVKLYESWDKAEPGKGYDVKAAEWKAKLDASTPPTEPAPPRPPGG